MRNMLRSSMLMIFTLMGFASLAHNSASSEETKSVTVWIYHNFPPFILDPDTGTGLSFELAKTLSTRSNGRYNFDVATVSRERLNHLLATGNHGLVFWANPAWFGDRKRQKFQWAPDLFVDHNDVISPITRPIRYNGSESLEGLTLAGVRGHRYPEIEPLLNAGKMVRDDVATEEHAVKFIAHGRADVSIIASSAARHFAQRPELKDRVFFSPKVFSTYTRSILMQTNDSELVGYVQAAVRDLLRTPEWSKMLSHYKLAQE